MCEKEIRVSLIIPLRLGADTYQGAMRLERICRTVPTDLFEILISDYGTSSEFAAPLAELRSAGIRVVSHPNPHALFSIGHSRDYGVQRATQPVVMFHDLDFLADEVMYRKIHSEVVARKMDINLFNFFCVPVMFLTEKGSSEYFQATAGNRKFIAENTIEWLEGADSIVQQAAFGSSAIVVNRHHFLSIGGHDPAFFGHGAEDYDLLHRLSSLAPRGPRPNEYTTDFKSNRVRDYWGFRAFFALYGLDVFFRGLYLVHLWHPRRKEKGYFRAKRNFKILRKAMLRFDKHGNQPDPLADLNLNDSLLVLADERSQSIAAFRQLFPLFGAYRIETRSAADAAAVWLDSQCHSCTQTVLLATGRMNQTRDELEPLLHGARLRLVSLVEGESPDVCIFQEIPAQASRSEPSIRYHFRTHRGTRIQGFFETLAFPGKAVLKSGMPLKEDTIDSPIFGSFGGPGALDRKLHKRPKREKKSSMRVRLFRWFTRT